MKFLAFLVGDFIQTSMKVQEAIGSDPLNPDNADVFYSDTISYVAGALLSDPTLQIVKVIKNPIRAGDIKLYYLAPRARAEELYQLYKTGQLNCDVRALSYKTQELKQMEATEVYKKIPTFEPVDPGIRLNPEKLEEWKNNYGKY